MVRHLIRFLGLAVLVIAFVSAVSILRREPKESSTAPLPIFAAAETPNPAKATEVLSPNGKDTLLLKEKKAEGGVQFTVFVSGKEIFTKTLPAGGSLSIPFNTFSPDNKYVFLKETSSTSANYYILPTAGGEAIDVSGRFNERFSEDYEIADVTGWGGINLLVINSQKHSGEKGPSFWFEAPGGALIRLSHSF